MNGENGPAAAPRRSTPHLASSAALARLARLTVKEMREILRDRRTILTLVLMPLLLYPLLSLAGNQVLLATSGQRLRTIYRVGVRDAEEERWLRGFITYGQDVLANAGALPERTQAARSPLEELTRQGDDLSLLGPQVEYHRVLGLEEAVRRGAIDVGLRMGPPPKDLGVDQWVRMDIEMVRAEGGSHAAVDHVQRALMACNERLAGIRLENGDFSIQRREPPLSVREVEVAPYDRGRPLSLITVAPLILILMTITGAVYPAIDLTAGERERGTLEILVAAPVPRMSLLLAKYAAVVSVACLTATINLVMMVGTVVVSGLGKTVFGQAATSWPVLGQVLLLLLLFATFFSALLLTVSSFARSFKEAQAYLVPLMLVSLTPGVLSLMPNMRLSGPMVIVPLINIVLLARDILEGAAAPLAAIPVVVSTLLYAVAAVALAARFFGAEAVLFGSQSGWSHLIQRPKTPTKAASVPAALWSLALLFPVHFTAVNLISRAGFLTLDEQVWASLLATALMFGLTPVIAAWFGNVRLRSVFSAGLPRALAWPGAVLLGLSLWAWAHESIILQIEWKIISISPEMLARFAAKLAELRGEIPLPAVLAVFALAPAVFEELFFRGFLLGALLHWSRSRYEGVEKRITDVGPIFVSALLFGAFHLVSSNTLAFERFVPSAMLGLVLGWVCVRTGSVWPGMALHVSHNGLIWVTAYRQERVQAALSRLGWDGDDRSHLPWQWLLASALVAVAGAALVWMAPAPARGANVPDGP